MDVAARSDEELALSFQKGEEAAFDELMRRYQGRVYAVAYRITSNREDALDVVQEVFLKAHRKIGMWQPRSGFGAWLMRLAANQAIDSLRRNKRHRHLPLESRGPGEPGRAQPEPGVENTERRLRAHEIEGRVQQALEALSPSQRAVFVMRHYEGLALADVAEALGCTVGSVKVHLFRALRKLRVELDDLVG